MAFLRLFTSETRSMFGKPSLSIGLLQTVASLGRMESFRYRTPGKQEMGVRPPSWVRLAALLSRGRDFLQPGRGKGPGLVDHVNKTACAYCNHYMKKQISHKWPWRGEETGLVEENRVSRGCSVALSHESSTIGANPGEQFFLPGFFGACRPFFPEPLPSRAWGRANIKLEQR